MPTKSTVYLYLRTFFDEKNLDERYYHVQSPTGDTLNLIPTGQRQSYPVGTGFLDQDGS